MDDKGIGWAFAELFRHLSLRRRLQFYAALALTATGAIVELVTIAAIIPFLAIATGSAGRYAAPIAVVTGVGTRIGLGAIETSACLLALVALVAVIVRLALTWVSHEFVFAAARDLAVQVYAGILRQPYEYHVAHNSSETLSGLDKIQHVTAYVLLPAILAVAAATQTVFIFAALICVDPLIALSSGACFAIIYLSISISARGLLVRNSHAIARSLTERVQTVQEGLGGIRDVIIDRSQPIFIAKFRAIETTFRRAQSINYFVSTAPRFIVEAGFMIFIAALSLYLARRPDGLLGSAPALGALALGAQRMLPLVQQVYVSWSSISGSRAALGDLANLLPRRTATSAADDGAAMPFLRDLVLDRVGYQYALSDAPALSEITLTVRRGDRIGVVGKSGSGKSTLVDLAMGLLDPTKGSIRIDGATLDAAGKPCWQAQIAHVPQTIFLSDGSIAANIAFGCDEEGLDMARVIEAARDAEVHDFIMTLPQGYSTPTGERGVRLSGGQRQRLGIARALYKRVPILILDEATSALDEHTEALVMASIQRLSTDLTILVVAHRLSTLRMCNSIIRLEDGRMAGTALPRGRDERVAQASA